MGTKTFNNYEDLLTFTRASKGHALRPVSYGTNLSQTTSGTFSYNATFNLSSAPIVDRVYELEYTITASDYTGDLYLPPPSGPFSYQIIAKTVGTHSYVVKAQDAQTTFMALGGASGQTGSITFSSISVKEVFFDQPDGTLTLFEHPDNIPRVEWDADRNRLGLLVEEARTNLITYSEDFSQPAWSKTAATVSSGVTAPDGSTSTKLIASATTGFHFTLFSVAMGAAAHTVSCYMKAGEYTTGSLFLTQSGNFGGLFDLSAETATASGTGNTASIENVGNGWYRCSVTNDGSADLVDQFRIGVANGALDSFAGDGTSGIYIYGAQLEAGSFPTSYIKTTGSTATRSADVASIKLSDFGFNYNALTLFVEAQRTNSDATFPRFLHISDDNVETIEIIGDTGDDVRMYARDTGGSAVVNADIVTGISIGDTFKAAFAMKQGDAAGSGNGATAVTDTDGFVMGKDISDDSLYLGSSLGSAQFLTGYIKQVKVYPRRLTNAQLQALTEPRSTPTLSLTFDGLESSYTENYIHG